MKKNKRNRSQQVESFEIGLEKFAGAARAAAQ
jgi:hypothetical protein